MEIFTFKENDLLNMKRIKSKDTRQPREGLIRKFNNPKTGELCAFKHYFPMDKKISINKLYIVLDLIKNANLIKIDELVLPQDLIFVRKVFRGFTMPLYPNSITLKKLLNDKDISTEDKIDYLKKVGSILRKMKEIRDSGLITNFYLNDLHEGNFIIDRDWDLHVVDMDSCKINRNKSSLSLYLSGYKSPIRDLPLKYKTQKSDSDNDNFLSDAFSRIEPSENTDLYCYMIMILNFILGIEYTHCFSIKDYYSILNVLKNNGMSRELISIFELIYSSEDNLNPEYYLDSLKDYLDTNHNYVIKTYYKQL